MRHIFEQITATSATEPYTFQVAMSYLEIYQEKVWLSKIKKEMRSDRRL
jgi:hypothetical protein